MFLKEIAINNFLSNKGQAHDALVFVVRNITDQALSHPHFIRPVYLVLYAIALLIWLLYYSYSTS